ncbi:hypothetical protein KSP40_PGU008724 [Platanthera guangdongensis]|uniref:Uncharacterized protein n=1 Tax=Platanthera guangdongensis TaxID=2320717 RepID=A0ABR2MQ74_9ASPA
MKSWNQSLAKMQGKVCLHFNLVVRPFPRPLLCGDALPKDLLNSNDDTKSSLSDNRRQRLNQRQTPFKASLGDHDVALQGNLGALIREWNLHLRACGKAKMLSPCIEPLIA